MVDSFASTDERLFPFDRSLKKLCASFLKDFVRYLGISPDKVESINVELTTVGRLVDTAWRVFEPSEHLVLVEFQSDRAPNFLLRLNLYVALLADKYTLPVRAVVFLLRPDADSGDLTGEWSLGLPGQPAWQHLRYDVVRIYEIPAETLLEGGLGLLPLAPVAAGAEEKLDTICQTVVERIQNEAPPELADKLLVATYLLMGLRYSKEEIHAVFKGVRWMKDSVTYQEIVREGFDVGIIKGREEGRKEALEKAIASMRRLLINVGSRRLGTPPNHILERIEAADQLEVIENWVDKASLVDSWDSIFMDP